MSYAIGVAHPTSVAVETFGTGVIPDEKIVELVRDNFDMRPGAIIRDLGLRRPIYKQVAAYLAISDAMTWICPGSASIKLRH